MFLKLALTDLLVEKHLLRLLGLINAVDHRIFNVLIKLVRDVGILRIAEANIRHVYKHCDKVFFSNKCLVFTQVEHLKYVMVKFLFT